MHCADVTLNVPQQQEVELAVMFPHCEALSNKCIGFKCDPQGKLLWIFFLKKKTYPHLHPESSKKIPFQHLGFSKLQNLQVNSEVRNWNIFFSNGRG